MDIKKYVEAEVPELIAARRHFHEYPEGSQQEFKTMDYIEDKLTQMGLSCVRVPRGGILATIDSGKPGYTVLMRADIDALPVQEDTVNLSKPKVAVSKNEGYSHACGHDGHIAMLLTEGKILAEHTDECLNRPKNLANGAANIYCSIYRTRGFMWILVMLRMFAGISRWEKWLCSMMALCPARFSSASG